MSVSVAGRARERLGASSESFLSGRVGAGDER